jgi:hypothetical protein
MLPNNILIIPRISTKNRPDRNRNSPWLATTENFNGRSMHSGCRYKLSYDAIGQCAMLLYRRLMIQRPRTLKASHAEASAAKQKVTK